MAFFLQVLLVIDTVYAFLLRNSHDRQECFLKVSHKCLKKTENIDSLFLTPGDHGGRHVNKWRYPMAWSTL